MKQILQTWVAGNQPTVEELQQLATAELADISRAAAFQITPETVTDVIEWRSQLFLSLLQQDAALPNIANRLELLWKLWLPLAIQLSSDFQALNRPIIQGILGGQGTGKTTLATALTAILEHLGHRTLSLSIDDLYKTYIEREHLRQADPRMIWRGPPGTHDVELGLQVLDQLRHPVSGESVAIPRFDKSLWNGAGGRIESQTVTEIDIILFEGWFVGCQPVDIEAFKAAPPPIRTDADKAFAQDINSQLKNYTPLWQYLDRLIVLNPIDYRLSKQWRKQAEQEMIATGKSGMKDTEIEQFVDYFWKALHPELFILPLVEKPELTDLVIEINADHSVGKIYKPLEKIK
ncbi:MAG: glycerate kinase [Microcoleaceae cyanobacterium]